MKQVFILYFSLITSISFSQSQTKILSDSTFTIGKTLTMESLVLGEDLILNIYLPLSYNGEEEKEYPVIYLLDGSEDEDFIHIEGLVKFGSFSCVTKSTEMWSVKLPASNYRVSTSRLYIF